MQSSLSSSPPSSGDGHCSPSSSVEDVHDILETSGLVTLDVTDQLSAGRGSELQTFGGILRWTNGPAALAKNGECVEVVRLLTLGSYAARANTAWTARPVDESGLVTGPDGRPVRLAKALVLAARELGSTIKLDTPLAQRWLTQLNVTAEKAKVSRAILEIAKGDHESWVRAYDDTDVQSCLTGNGGEVAEAYTDSDFAIASLLIDGRRVARAIIGTLGDPVFVNIYVTHNAIGHGLSHRLSNILECYGIHPEDRFALGSSLQVVDDKKLPYIDGTNSSLALDGNTATLHIHGGIHSGCDSWNYINQYETCQCCGDEFDPDEEGGYDDFGSPHCTDCTYYCDISEEWAYGSPDRNAANIARFSIVEALGTGTASIKEETLAAVREEYAHDAWTWLHHEAEDWFLQFVADNKLDDKELEHFAADSEEEGAYCTLLYRGEEQTDTPLAIAAWVQNNELAIQVTRNPNVVRILSSDDVLRCDRTLDLFGHL